MKGLKLLKLTRNDTLRDELIQEIDESMHDDNRAQPSVSGMIYCLTKTFYENEMVMPNEQGIKRVKHTDQQVMLFITGLGLEKVILSGRQVIKAGNTDGIQWHIDQLEVGDKNFMEIKSTRISASKIFSDKDLSEGWVKQILAYFYVNGITEGDLAILHLMGNYKPPFPELVVWHMEASNEEISTNWDWIKERSYTYADAVRSGEPPTPFKHNMEWECNNCNWKGLCTAKSTLSSMRTV